MEKTLYVSDLDGTLLGSDQRVSARSCEMINRLVAEGMSFTCATARSMVTAKKVMGGLKGNIPLILYNGAFVRDNDTGEILDSVFIPKALAGELLDWYISHGIYPIVYAYIDGVEHFSYVPGLCGRAEEEFVESRGADPRLRVTDERGLFDGEIFYITAIGDNIEEAKERFSAFPELNCIYQRDIYSGEQWLELVSVEATKARAIKRVMKLTGCGRMVCFGDAVNDLPMFEEADECYAVANADERLKERATGIIGSNDEDAVALWLAGNAVF